MRTPKTRARAGQEPKRATPRISYLIGRIERRIRAELDTALRPLGITASEYTTLSVLAHRSGLSSAQLARRAFVSAQAMNQIVTALERNGWIARSQDPDHARVLRSTLTRPGRSVLSACDQATRHIETTLLSRLSERQVDALRSSLEHCAAAMFESARAGEAGEAR